MLVRKWGILWSPLEHPLRVNVRLTYVCLKLHNVCMTSHLLTTSAMAEEFMAVEKAELSSRNDSTVQREMALVVVSIRTFAIEQVDFLVAGFGSFVIRYSHRQDFCWHYESTKKNRSSIDYILTAYHLKCFHEKD